MLLLLVLLAPVLKWYLLEFTSRFEKYSLCNTHILLHETKFKGIFAVLSGIWKCRKSRILVLTFWAKTAAGATFFAFCNYVAYYTILWYSNFHTVSNMRCTTERRQVIFWNVPNRAVSISSYTFGASISIFSVSISVRCTTQSSEHIFPYFFRQPLTATNAYSPRFQDPILELC